MPTSAGNPLDPLLTVTYKADLDDPGQDEVFEFSVDGQRRRFGRDDGCDIVIWSAINGRELTRVAGEIWRFEGELWVRNLSTAHELFITEPGQPAEEPLRRRRDADARGAACAIPAPQAVITAPGGCRLEVLQLHQGPPEILVSELEATETMVPPVPEEYRRLAAALCEPLLRGGRLPAAYKEVMARVGQPSLRTLRKDVERLCTHYTNASPLLAERVRERREREVAVRQGGPSRSVGLSLPDYYEVALLLVRYYRITEDDLPLLPPLPEGA